MKRILKQNGEIRYELSSEERKLVMEEAQSNDKKSRVLDYLQRTADTYIEKEEK